MLPNPLLSGKTALVTGSGRGIGMTIARLLASQGARVAVHYHSSGQDAQALAKELDSVALQADLTDPAQAKDLIAQTVAHLGRLDVLVNNAASFATPKPFEEDDWGRYVEEWNGVLGATFHPIKAAIPQMKAQGGGRIINFVATLVDRPAIGYGAHTASKAAVLALTRTLARELGPYNISVNAVSPGMTLTDFSKSLPQKQRDAVAHETPLRRLAGPEDVAKIVLFYASDLADFVTGANIAPDGGLAVL